MPSSSSGRAMPRRACIDPSELDQVKREAQCAGVSAAMTYMHSRREVLRSRASLWRSALTLCSVLPTSRAGSAVPSRLISSLHGIGHEAMGLPRVVEALNFSRIGSGVG